MTTRTLSPWNVAPMQQHQQDAPAPIVPPAPIVDPPAPPAKTFTQEELNQIVAREKASVKTATATETAEALAKDLGCTIEEAKGYIATAKAADDAQKTEAQKATDAATKAAADSAKAAAEAAAEGMKAKITIALVSAGVPVVAEKPEDQAKVDAKLATLIKLVDVAADADAEAIKAAVATLKETMPELFAGATPGIPKAPNSDPATPTAPTKQQEDAMKRGAERRKTEDKTSGYAWEAPAPAPAST